MSSRTLASSRTSARQRAARPPAASIARTVSRAPASSMSETTTAAPQAAKHAEIDRPQPAPPAPVTTTTRASAATVCQRLPLQPFRAPRVRLFADSALVVGLHDERRNTHLAAVAIDRDEGQKRRARQLTPAGERFLGEDVDLHLE